MQMLPRYGLKNRIINRLLILVRLVANLSYTYEFHGRKHARLLNFASKVALEDDFSYFCWYCPLINDYILLCINKLNFAFRIIGTSGGSILTFYVYLSLFSMIACIVMLHQ